MTLITKRPQQSADDCVMVSSIYGDVLYLGVNFQMAGRDWDGEVDYYYYGGMRFPALEIPQGATIESAYLKFIADLDYTVTIVKTRIKGEAADNANIFTNIDNYIARTRTTAYVDWLNIPAWYAETLYTSPDIKTIIQEIINRSGWASGNALVLFWDENGSSKKAGCARAGYAWDANPSKATLLEITYSVLAPAVLRRKLLGVGR